MSVNRSRPHVLVLPEDDANLRLANGFHLQVDWTRYRQMQVLPVAVGGNEVLHLFESEHLAEMSSCPSRLMVLLIDCDGNAERLERARSVVPDYLIKRVFFLGVLSEPEALRADLGSYESIGSAMASDCREGSDTIWKHRLLQHNATEVARMRQYVRPILFS